MAGTDAAAAPVQPDAAPAPTQADSAAKVVASGSQAAAPTSPALGSASCPAGAAPAAATPAASSSSAGPDAPAGAGAAAADGAPDRPIVAAAPAAPVRAAKSGKRAKAAKSNGASGDGAQEAADLKPATASREDNLLYDLKNMAAFDISPLHPKTDFLAYTRDTVQLLVNRMFALPRKQTEDGTIVELPKEESFRLPRQKRIPKVKAKTRWEKFAEERNMRKRKRSRLVWDEVSQDWLPRWGYKSSKRSEDRTQAVFEVKEGDNPMDNPFDKQAAEKKLLIARQKMREVRNKVEAAGGKLRASVPDLENVKTAKRGKEGLREAIKRAQVSSASFGKFDRVAPNEATNLQPTKKKKGSGPVSLGDEKDRYLKAATRVLSGAGSVDKAKAAKLGASQGEKKKKGGSLSLKGTQKRRSKQGGRKPKGGKR